MRTEPPPTRVLSPELALVDDNLAAWARLRLHEEAVAAEVAAATAVAAEVAAATAVAAPRPAVPEREDVERVEPDRRPPSLIPLAIATAAAAAIIAAVAVALRPSTDDSARPAAAIPSTPTPTMPTITTPTATRPTATVPFAWPGVTAARAYVFTLSRGTKVIYRGRTTAEQFALKRSWTYQGQRYSLTRGAYRWHVIALVKSAPHGTRTVISAPFWIDRSPSSR